MASEIEIRQWRDIAPTAERWDGLLIGNGGSIALHPGFAYRSLYLGAVSAGRLTTTDALFKSLQGGTTNFEYVMFALSHARLVAETLKTSKQAIDAAYDEVRQALIDTVNDVHCAHAAILGDLDRIASFAKAFDTIVTYNYDLTFYWAMLEGNKAVKNWFKDGFVGAQHTFDPEWEWLRKPFNGNKGTSLVFFGHGSLLLGTDGAGQERKVVTHDEIPLLDSIAERWGDGLTPLFVSEGTSAQKLHAIRRSAYLSTVHHQVLTSFGGKRVVAYGLSFAENDEHILDALSKSPPAQLAVSVYRGSGLDGQEFCHRVLAAAKARRLRTKVEFFDSSSSGCWNTP